MIIYTVESLQTIPKLENSIIWFEIFESLPPACTFTHDSDSLLKDFLLSPIGAVTTFQLSMQVMKDDVLFSA